MSIKTSFKMIGSLTLRVNEHRSVQSNVILSSVVTVTSYLICVFDTVACGESVLLSEEYCVVDRVRLLLRIYAARGVGR